MTETREPDKAMAVGYSNATTSVTPRCTSGQSSVPTGDLRSGRGHVRKAAVCPKAATPRSKSRPQFSVFTDSTNVCLFVL